MASNTKALRLLSIKQADHSHHSAFREQVDAGPNDRGACILLAANVENALDAAIGQIILVTESNYETLFNQDGPLATFARKIAMGRALGIFGPETHSNIKLIRHLRNAFAHAKIPITFNTPEVAAVSNDLTLIEVLHPRTVRRPLDKSKMSPRQLFEEVANAMAHNFFVWSLSPILEIHADGLNIDIGDDYKDNIVARRKALP